LVVVGVIAELAIAIYHPLYDSFLEQWGSSLANGLVALGVAFEIKFGQMSGLRQTELRRRSDKELAEAKAALAKVLTSRAEIIFPHKEEIIAKISPFAGTKFDIGHSKRGREEWDFLWQFEEVPAKAGWEFVEWAPNPNPHPSGVFRKYNWTGQLRVYGEANVSNVVIELEPENRDRLLPAATALVDALNEIGISASVAQVRINEISATRDAIHILVGPKE
jgi:hypothetical protein